MIGRTFRYGAVWRGLGLLCAGLGVVFPLLMYANNEQFTATSNVLAAAFVIVGAYGYAYARAYRLEFRPDGFAIYRLAREMRLMRWRDVQSVRTDHERATFVTSDGRKLTVSNNFDGYHPLLEEAARNLPRAAFGYQPVPIVAPELVSAEQQRVMAHAARDLWKEWTLRLFAAGLALVAAGEAAGYVNDHAGHGIVHVIVALLSGYGSGFGFIAMGIGVLFALMWLQELAHLRKLPPQ